MLIGRMSCGQADMAILRIGVTYRWFVRDSATGAQLPVIQWGKAGDKPLSGDEMRLVNNPA